MKNIDLIKQIKDVFDPIAKKNGMLELPIVTHTNTEVSFAYLKNNIGVKIKIELSYFFIFALIFRTKDGNIPAGYEDKNGVPHVVYISEALKKIGIDASKEKKELQKLGRNHKNYLEMTNILAQLFESNWELIQSKASIIFQK